jgi:hypothetical protein
MAILPDKVAQQRLSFKDLLLVWRYLFLLLAAVLEVLDTPSMATKLMSFEDAVRNKLRFTLGLRLYAEPSSLWQPHTAQFS